MRSNSLRAAIFAATLFGYGRGMRRSEPQRVKDPARDAERILAAEQKRARKAARRATRSKV
jgi:hypothetical protein